MPVTETILSKRVGLPFCVLGSYDYSPPGIGLFRDDFNPPPYNRVYGASYPETSPDNIMRKVRAYNGADQCPGPPTQIFTASYGGIYNGTCVDDEGNPVGGSPYEIDDIQTDPLWKYGNRLYPRWESEDEYDWQNNAFGQQFTPLDFPSSSSAFSVSFGLGGEGRSIAMSYDSGIVPNDPAAGGGDSHYVYATNFGIWSNIPSVSCWNDGAELVFNLVVHKIPITLQFIPGTQGAHTFEYGSPSQHSIITKTITISENGFHRLEEIPIPVEIGHITYVNDFYISSVTAP
jgi:hypothetical protein